MKINVANKKCIRHISFRNMKSAKARNVIAIMAIALTTILFTALFTIIMSVVYGYQQSNFRQVGGYEHGCFKSLTEEQFKELQGDPLISEWGLRRFLAMPTEGAFAESHVEISYVDANAAEWTFLKPIEGNLPTEGTNEAATDTTVLNMLGIEPKIGEKFTLTFDVDGTETTQEFTLCGYWEYDPLAVANHIIIPESLVNEILTRLDVRCIDGTTGRYTMDVMFDSASNIEKDLLTILDRHGYQTVNAYEKENYVAIGINWGYLNARLDMSMDFETAVSIIGMLLLIVFTGYLIIYNLFQISVTNDIRFYGLLKTIGTTGRQLKHMIYIQAFLLSIVGIPIGLLTGYGVGALITPIVLANISVYGNYLSVSPWIFIGSAVFSLVTVFFSCKKPGRMAARVSPIEALRYTENAGVKKKRRQNAETGASIYKMAYANLGRNRKKTVITVISLSLSVVLLNITTASTKSFDLDKYLENTKGMTVDFIVADAKYFQTYSNGFTEEIEVPKEVISALKEKDGITGSGRTYGRSSIVNEFISEELYRNILGKWASEEDIDERIKTEEKKDGYISNTVQLYGMEPFCLDNLKLIEGDITKLYENEEPYNDKAENSSDNGVSYIAAAYYEDDYGNIMESTHWAKVGDKVRFRYIDEVEIYNTVTGEIYPDMESIPYAEWLNADARVLKYRDMEYEVAAVVVIPTVLSYRYMGLNYEYVMGADTFIRDTGTDNVMYYALDVEDSAIEGMENYISDFTRNVMPQYDYESRQVYVDEFESFNRMYLICGSALSFIIGLVGVLNFLNAVLTSIMTRHREFAVLQSVGMTGRQLITMLIAEGVMLSLAAIVASLAITVITAPLVANVLGGMFAFFTYRFTALPLVVVTPAFIILGILIPFITYSLTSGESIVERLREAE